MIDTEHQKNRFVVNDHIAVILEIIFDPERHKIRPERIAVLGMCSVCGLPDDTVFHFVAVTCVHVAVVQVNGVARGFERCILLVGIPAERLKINAVFG